MNCLINFMNENNLNVNINNNKSPYISLTPNVAKELVDKYMDNDGYVDSYVYPNGTMYKQIPSQYKYYVYVPVYRNRSIENICYLFDKFGNKRHSFKCRTHGQPNLNQLTSDGDTPTGLYTFDLNTPEDNPVEYGPYDVNRAVYGLKGNSLLIYPKYRSGILMHTGEWNIKPNDPMPNSHGCIHAMPHDIQLIANILKNELGVVANENTFGKYPYPYQQQGLLSVVLIK
ncbi:predicted protein [Naegleria gruberi]|uniref:Predicted protein n=1 Tax=Naegleria gruberi TaxID=5762 RepID=D2VZE5_NAEGR|nr:uncharacterized protein NAEGRDRAFT_74461 [Naegleria gruberi]EFC37778.1 predicted protein [Naegleria gruberi]|eukprot:XP_002670522.1 predicted protein [Naegleria gruberi strain NEG-M]